MGTSVAVFGGGCFWCLEAVFQRRKGVLAVVPGYAGGDDPEPDYRKVCTGTTGHAEVVLITFDPEVVTYDDLLDLFWACHDPTTKDRQGCDVGTQYRSIILWSTDKERQVAEASLTEAQARFAKPIVTEVAKLVKFYPAEAEHHDYFNQHRTQGYCSMVIAPKVDKLVTKGAISG